ncbi:lysine exporter LysO family protein [Aminipila terrae]|uniref:LysO family transporter n=1 Tax=Aminipila terrae TaxID=2697030 RepID=A0A6P1MIZ7_9FIRM|nr:lysine exporter LysO family protein [Aminipila terrae]QHI71035.1 LysO family transporter [Aminipila terrae]
MIFLMPFISIFIGLSVGLKIKSRKFLKIVDIISNIVLIILMITIGSNIGVNDSLMKSLGQIGINCFLISTFAIGLSIIVTFSFEKSMKLLDNINIKTDDIQVDILEDTPSENASYKSPLIWSMPLGIVSGIAFGRFLLPVELAFLLDYVIRICLIIIYIGVGISLGNNSDTLKYMKQLGWRILLVPVAILFGSILGGVISGFVLGLPLKITLISSAGMSYYSVTGAYMSSAYGVGVGTYGFVVNVIREFLTVLCLPLIIRISPGSAIASGGAGDMDTMLLPIQKFVGRDLGLVTLFNGTVLTMIVPFLLPILSGLLSLFNLR